MSAGVGEALDRVPHHPQVAAGRERPPPPGEHDRPDRLVARELLGVSEQLHHQRGAQHVALLGVGEVHDGPVAVPLDRNELALLGVGGGDHLGIGPLGHQEAPSMDLRDCHAASASAGRA